MSHEVENMFVARELAWHKLGTLVEEEIKSDEVFRVVPELDYVLVEAPIFVDGIEVPDMIGIYRSTDKKVVGIHSKGYKTFTPREMFNFSDAVADTGEARYTSAGSLREGKVIFSTMVIDRPLVVAGDEHIPYLVTASSHDGSLAFTAAVTPVRVVCMNTLRLAIGVAKYTWKIKHTSRMMSQVQQARESLNLTFQYLDGFEREVNSLIAQEVTNADFKAIMERVFPKGETELQGKNREGIVEAIQVAYRSDEIGEFRGTGWGVVNAVNSWELWGKAVRGKVADRDNLRMERQAIAILKGEEAPATQETHKLLVSNRFGSRY